MEPSKAPGNVPVDLSSIPGMVYQFILKPDGTQGFPYISAGAYDLLGLDPQEAMQDPAFILDAILPDYVGAFHESVALSAQTMEPWFFEMPIMLASGQVKWVEGHSRPHRQQDGSILWHGLVTDITEHKNRKARLRKSENMLRQAERQAKLGAWEWDLQNPSITWSEELYRIHEVAAAHKPDPAAAINFYAPEVRPQLQEAVHQCLTNGKAYDLVLPFITAKGNHLWVRTIGQADVEDGQVLRVHGTLQDITGRKQAEEQLRVVFEHTTSAHLLYDESGIIDCNGAALSMLGFTAKGELQGRQLLSFVPEFQADGSPSLGLSQRARELVRSQGYHRFECRLRRGNGEEFPAQVTMNWVIINRKRVILTMLEDLTSRKQAQEMVTLTESRWMLTQELTQSGSLEKDLVRNVNVWSPQAFRIFGLPQTGTGPSNEQIRQCIHPDDRVLHQQAIDRALYQKESTHLVLRLITSQQEEKYVDIITKPIADEKGEVVKIYGAILDITRQKNAEKDLLLKQEQLKTFIEYSPVALVMFDKQMCYIAASKVWLEIHGLPENDIIGKCHYDLNPEIPDKWKEAHHRGLAGEILKNNADVYVNRQGQEEWIRWEVWPWYENEEEPGGIILFSEVITEQKKARQELIEAKDQAEQAAIAKSQFLSTMSHEIRTPMNAVIGLTHLLLQNEPRADQLENLRTLRFSAENLMVLINDILDFNKIEAGKITFEEIPFSIEDLVRNIRHALRPQAAEKGVALKLMLDDELPPAVIGDPVRLGQVLTNLIGNAIKFTSQGKVTVTVHLEQKDSLTTAISFQVEDTGIGISAENLTHIFERFTQATADTTRKYGGTGLGLAITKRLLELQGSQIQVSSSLGAGSTFYFTLAFKTSDAVVKSDRENKNLSLQSLQGTRVLMAEDYPVNVLIVQQFLHKWDIELDVAENGLVALEMVQRQDYDLVLMDLQMPKMDGYQAAAAIRALGGRYRQLPIIALTASAMLDIQDKAFEVGMNDYISKPFEPNELYNKIARHAAQYRA